MGNFEERVKWLRTVQYGGSALRSTTTRKKMSMDFRRTSLSYVNLLYLVERFVLQLEQNISRDFGNFFNIIS